MWFAVVVIILLAVAVAGLVAYLLELRKAALAADDRLTELSSELDSAQQQLTEATSDLADVREQLSDAQVELDRIEAVASRLRDEAAAARRAADEANEALLAARSSGHDAAALWALELARSERRWRQSVAPGIDVPSPFADTDDALHLAVDVEAAALREEVGTRIEVEWAAPAGLSADQSVVVLRLAQELLASAAKPAETLDLRVSADGPDVVVSLRALDENDDEVAIELPALPEGRVRLEGSAARVAGANGG
jgi:hypothetical protein